MGGDVKESGGTGEELKCKRTINITEFPNELIQKIVEVEGVWQLLCVWLFMKTLLWDWIGSDYQQFRNQVKVKLVFGNPDPEFALFHIY